METDNSLPWVATYLPFDVAQGILGILIPLYMVQELGATLIDLGTMTFAASALLIPTSIYLGSLPDRHRASKPFILASLLGVSIILYAMSATFNVVLFQLLYVTKELIGYLKGPSTSILIAETYNRGSRSRAIARQGLIEGVGAVIGLGACMLTVNAIGYRTLLAYTAPLVFVSFVFALLTLREPPLHIERNFDRLDRAFGKLEDFSYHLNRDGTIAPSLDGKWRFGRSADMRMFGIGKALFSFAASNAFTTLTVFLLTRAKFTNSTIFAVFQVRSIIGALSYLFVGKIAGSEGERPVLTATFMRIVLVASIPLVLTLPTPANVVAAAILLSLVALSWSIYSVGAEMVAVTYAASGSLGIFDAFASLGGALGNYSGGLIPTLFGFEVLFMISAALFALALLIFYVSLRAG